MAMLNNQMVDGGVISFGNPSMRAIDKFWGL